MNPIFRRKVNSIYRHRTTHKTSCDLQSLNKSYELPNNPTFQLLERVKERKQRLSNYE